MTPSGSGERGSATVWMLALCGVLGVVGAAAVLTGAAVVARHRATAAADLAALAAAGRAVAGDAGPCVAAQEVAAANAAELTSCTVGAGAVVEVAVRIRVRLGGLGVHWATARAGAGPVVPGPQAAPLSGATGDGKAERCSCTASHLLSPFRRKTIVSRSCRSDRPPCVVTAVRTSCVSTARSP
jgi:secretion/DNA translocation related TadE-like protein